MNTIVIVGSGNVATQMAVALKNVGFKILQVYSREYSNAVELAALTMAKPINAFEDVDTGADLYLIAITDKHIAHVAESMPLVNGVVAHTAGSVCKSVLSRFPFHGVFYPFQTFTKGKSVDVSKVPIVVEGDRSETTVKLLNVAKRISTLVLESDTATRAALHVGAVMASNFVNHLYTLADEWFEMNNLDFSLLEPLMSETTSKALSVKPFLAQTGPAKRCDNEVIQKHLELLKKSPELHQIYALLTKSIMKKHGA